MKKSKRVKGSKKKKWEDSKTDDDQINKVETIPLELEYIQQVCKDQRTDSSKRNTKINSNEEYYKTHRERSNNETAQAIELQSDVLVKVQKDVRRVGQECH